MPDFQTFGLFVLIALVAFGLVFIIGARILRAGPLRGRLIFLGCNFIGIAFLCLATADLYLIQTSDRITIQGSICALSQVHGKSSASFFNLQDNVDGVSSRLSTDYAGARLQNGEQVRLTHLSNTMDVTDLQVLSGPYTGWTLHEGNGTLTSVFLLLLGGVFIFIAFYTRRTNPDGKTRTSNENGNGVDEQSLLNLNDH